MPVGDPLSVGVSGLLTSQRALSIVSHNVTNVNTDGYSRQRTEISTRLPSYSGAGYMGSGVQTTNVSRLYSDFVNNQVVSNTAAKNYQQTLYDYSYRVDNLLADPNAGLNPTLQSYFDSFQGLTSDPISIPAREVVMTEANALVERFHIMYDRMEELRDNTNEEITNMVSEINSLSQELANLNKAIATSPGLVQGILPNDLLDKRDSIVKEMSQYVDVQTIVQSNLSMNLYIGNGQTLVAGFEAQTLELSPNEFDTSQLEIGYQVNNAGKIVNITSLLKGGRLGGMLEFREEVVTPSQNSLGRIAIALSEEMNRQNRLGMDLNSELGTDLFSYPNPIIALPSVYNSATAPTSVSFEIVNPDALPDSNYLLRYNGATFDLVNQDTGTVTPTGFADTGGAPRIYPAPPADFNGFQVTIPDSAGNYVTGDSYLIQPTRYGARNISVAITDSAKIAAASPIRTGADLNNIGNGTLNLTSVSDTDPATSDFVAPGSLDPELRVVFNDPSTTYDVYDVTNAQWLTGPAAAIPTASITYDPTVPTGVDVVASVQAVSAIAILGGYEVQLGGDPQVGDVFTVEFNSQGTSDNRNALDLAGLQTELSMLGGKASFQDAYGEMVSSVGSQTHRADIANLAQDTLLRQIIEEREKISGVNLDEEASDLLRYQQAYNAAAQVIAAAGNLFDELINVVRR